MRNYLIAATLFLSSLLTYNNTQAQSNKIGCLDTKIRLQSEQIKQDFVAQGMVVYKDAMLSMDNKEPYPVAIQLTGNEMYQMVFVGSNQATKLFFELFDGNQKKIAEKVVENNGTNNFIIHSFMPPKSDMYLLVVSQKVKGLKQMCGGLSVMKQPMVTTGKQ